jgi:hypothetical protein
MYSPNVQTRADTCCRAISRWPTIRLSRLKHCANQVERRETHWPSDHLCCFLTLSQLAFGFDVAHVGFWFGSTRVEFHQQPKKKERKMKPVSFFLSSPLPLCVLVHVMMMLISFSLLFFSFFELKLNWKEEGQRIDSPGVCWLVQMRRVYKTKTTIQAFVSFSLSLPTCIELAS